MALKGELGTFWRFVLLVHQLQQDHLLLRPQRAWSLLTPFKGGQGGDTALSISGEEGFISPGGLLYWLSMGIPRMCMLYFGKLSICKICLVWGLRVYRLFKSNRCASSPHTCVCVRGCCPFSRVRLFATLLTLAHWAPLSMGFSKQEYWSGLPYPPPGKAHTL